MRLIKEDVDSSLILLRDCFKLAEILLPDQLDVGILMLAVLVWGLGALFHLSIGSHLILMYFSTLQLGCTRFGEKVFSQSQDVSSVGTSLEGDSIKLSSSVEEFGVYTATSRASSSVISFDSRQNLPDMQGDGCALSRIYKLFLSSCLELQCEFHSELDQAEERTVTREDLITEAIANAAEIAELRSKVIRMINKLDDS